ncbi:MAG TPA: DNA-3-methyladenine glycosylase I [Caldilineaceae bacterium]|nr:DNA-3-methyladenine glycosylase I [Caldilineaceae bacterium]
MTQSRCEWVNPQDPLYLRYHDEEWGVPVRDDQALFERLCLEGAQAGLSWITILRKRENYRAAFDHFAPERVAGYGEDKVAELLQNPGIVRNRAKIHAAIHNARCYLALQTEVGSVAGYLWSFVGGRTRHNYWRSLAEIPAVTEESKAMSQALSKRGFKFVGPTICYAMMQAVGMVNDHTLSCFRHAELRDGSV